ncbi:hypothetical protein GGR56DRAFT_677816 [Xylariaceae sp. FL0804]|nr:hypothetical protein GGR56DRAFT_677816 [Xylariaceae sp. FL0804]
MAPPISVDHYKVLGVSRNAQVPEIRTAYRKLVLKCHPDKVQDPELKEAKQIEFQRVQRAYEVLSNEDERTRFDDTVKLSELREERERDRMMKQHVRSNSSPRTPKRQDPVYYVNVKDASPRPSTYSSPYARTPPRSWEDTSSKTSQYEEVRKARKAASYEKEKPSRRDESRQRRREREEAEVLERIRREEKEARRERAARDEERRRKEERDEERKRKEEKRRRELDRGRERDRARKSAAEDKFRRHEPPNEVLSDEDEVYTTATKSDKKKKSSSSRKHEELPRQRSNAEWDRRDRKFSDTYEFAQSYLARSGGNPRPGLSLYPPPTLETMVEEEPAMRSAARPSSRRMPSELSRSSKEKSFYKKTGAPEMNDVPLPRVVPTFAKSKPNYSSEESGDDRDYYRRSRRTHSPEVLPPAATQTTYKVAPRSAEKPYRTVKIPTYAGSRSYPPELYDDEPRRVYDNVNYTQQFSEHNISYAPTYRGDPVPGY